jgi:hypothetical protein
VATFTERPDLASVLIRDIEAAYSAKRAEKGNEPHVSDILYCLAKAWYRRNGYTGPERDERDILTLLDSSARRTGRSHFGLMARRSRSSRRLAPLSTRVRFR